MAKPIIRRTTHQTYFFTEDLGNGIGLDMALIPGGEFMMGSPDTEEGRRENESPQHRVRVPTFFMGCYPITQAQWCDVSAFPKVKRILESNPSYFRGETRPVERVSWDDAVEFCDRLSRHTGRNYRLPSEAEWEYACRGETSTPFHFGETISTDLANYNGNNAYGRVIQDVYRDETTPIGYFGVANAFGLYEMHGNVWEWCMDHWHENYEGAPSDGTAWLSGDETISQVVRGGSWLNPPRSCRSALRYRYNQDYRIFDLGFRVACSTTSSPATDN